MCILRMDTVVSIVYNRECKDLYYRIYDLEINVLMVAAGIESPKLNGLEGQSKDQKLKLLNRYE